MDGKVLYLSSMQSHSTEARVMVPNVRVLQHNGSFDIQHFGNYTGVVWRKTSELTEGFEGLFVAFLDEQPSRRIGVEEHADAEDQSWNDLDSEGNSPGGVGLAGASIWAYVVVGVENWGV